MNYPDMLSLIPIVYDEQEKENFAAALPKLQKLMNDYKSFALISEEQ